MTTCCFATTATMLCTCTAPNPVLSTSLEGSFTATRVWVRSMALACLPACLLACLPASTRLVRGMRSDLSSTTPAFLWQHPCRQPCSASHARQRHPSHQESQQETQEPRHPGLRTRRQALSACRLGPQADRYRQTEGARNLSSVRDSSFSSWHEIQGRPPKNPGSGSTPAKATPLRRGARARKPPPRNPFEGARKLDMTTMTALTSLL